MDSPSAAGLGRCKMTKPTAEASERLKRADDTQKPFKAKYSTVMEWHVVDDEIEEFAPFPALVEREGGWGIKENVVVAFKYMEKCLHMKGK
eukprot:7080781-Pyramimonas_sp.AAC.1